MLFLPIITRGIQTAIDALLWAASGWPPLRALTVGSPLDCVFLALLTSLRTKTSIFRLPIEGLVIHIAGFHFNTTNWNWNIPQWTFNNNPLLNPESCINRILGSFYLNIYMQSKNKKIQSYLHRLPWLKLTEYKIICNAQLRSCFWLLRTTFWADQQIYNLQFRERFENITVHYQKQWILLWHKTHSL